MARLARRIAASGYYHVILKGNGGRILFENDSDKLFFLRLLEKYGAEHKVEYLAWCLMSNHIHLLIHDTSNQMGMAMHDICGLYAAYYNRTNDHVGRVFQNRYTSRAIETDNYLLEVVRYIHQNPVRAKITQSLDFPWSSYDEYISGGTITSTKMILEMLGGVDGFREYCSNFDSEVTQMIENYSVGRLTDEEALEHAKRILGESLFKRLNQLERHDRDDCLCALARNGLTVSQIARITGIGRSIVQRAAGKSRMHKGDSPL